ALVFVFVPKYSITKSWFNIEAAKIVAVSNDKWNDPRITRLIGTKIFPFERGISSCKRSLASSTHSVEPFYQPSEARLDSISEITHGNANFKCYSNLIVTSLCFRQKRNGNNGG